MLREGFQLNIKSGVKTVSREKETPSFVLKNPKFSFTFTFLVVSIRTEHTEVLVKVIGWNSRGTIDLKNLKKDWFSQNKFMTKNSIQCTSKTQPVQIVSEKSFKVKLFVNTTKKNVVLFL